MDIACDISKLGPNKVIITGIIQNGLVYNFAYNRVVNNSVITSSEFNGKAYSGTGDVFDSIICGMLVQGCEFSVCVEKATRFIHETIKYTSKLTVDPRNGILLEPMLKDLIFDNEFKR